ncbi:hypothetical protein D046_6733A, partial [Vibrio parahaemolyticus V-223/04]
MPSFLFDIFILFVVNKINPNFCVSRLYYS